jgi:hypothetical protein
VKDADTALEKKQFPKPETEGYLQNQIPNPTLEINIGR